MISPIVVSKTDKYNDYYFSGDKNDAIELSTIIEEKHGYKTSI